MPDWASSEGSDVVYGPVSGQPLFNNPQSQTYSWNMRGGTEPKQLPVTGASPPQTALPVSPTNPQGSMPFASSSGAFPGQGVIDPALMGKPISTPYGIVVPGELPDYYKKPSPGMPLPIPPHMPGPTPGGYSPEGSGGMIPPSSPGLGGIAPHGSVDISGGGSKSSDPVYSSTPYSKAGQYKGYNFQSVSSNPFSKGGVGLYG